MQIETSRLCIREFRAEDLDAVHQYASSAEVAKYMIWGPNTLDETKEFIGRVIEMQEQQPRLDYELAVVLKDSHELIGGCGIHISNPQQGEIGYCFNPLFWRKGYASEAAAAMLRLRRIYARCRPDNRGSAKVMEHIGMKFEGHLREHMRHKGKWHDSYQYSILEHEYVGGRV